MGKIVCFVGPSGVGKTSYINRLKNEFGFITPTIVTTRKPREDDNSHYVYVDESSFRRMIKSGDFLEWDEYGDYYYGTKKDSVSNAGDDDYVLDLTPVGCRQIQAKIPEAIIIALLPDDASWLKKRLFERGTNNVSEIERRTKLLDGYIEQVEKMNTPVVRCKFSPSSWEDTFQEIVNIVNS